MMHTSLPAFAGALLVVLATSAACPAQEAAATDSPSAAGTVTISPLQMMRNPLGDRIPDVALVDDTGKEVRFFTDLVKDRAVVISFFYTNCRGTCPGTNLVLAELRQILAQDFGRSVRLISISIEPEKDDVPAIAEYAAQFRTEATDPDTPEWVFLTGEPEAIRDLRRKLDYYDIDAAVDSDPTQHAAAVIVGNQATGRWGIMPVGLGAKRLGEKVRTLAGWTSGQRYAVTQRWTTTLDQPQGDTPADQTPGGAVPDVTPAITAAPTIE